MKDCIGEFIDNWKKWDAESKLCPDDPNWMSRFTYAGYYRAKLTSLKEWEAVHDWCRETYGEEHYCWTGITFWFESAEDALLFSLTWP